MLPLVRCWQSESIPSNPSHGVSIGGGRRTIRHDWTNAIYSDLYGHLQRSCSHFQQERLQRNLSRRRQEQLQIRVEIAIWLVGPPTRKGPLTR
jgi:hypothetical protein